MRSITVRNIPEEVHRAIRVRAAMHGHSTAAEVRSILEQAARPEGKRRTIYLDRQEHEVLPAFSGRILPFDLDASRAYSDLMTGARKAGKPSARRMATSLLRLSRGASRSPPATPVP